MGCTTGVADPSQIELYTSLHWDLRGGGKREREREKGGAGVTKRDNDGD